MRRGAVLPGGRRSSPLASLRLIPIVFGLLLVLFVAELHYHSAASLEIHHLANLKSALEQQHQNHQKILVDDEHHHLLVPSSTNEIKSGKSHHDESMTMPTKESTAALVIARSNNDDDGTAALKVEVESKLYKDIFTSPLTKQQRRERRKFHNDNGDGSSRSDNVLVALYRDVEEDMNDIGFFSGSAWETHPQLASLLRKFQSLNNVARAETINSGRSVLVRPVGQLCNRLIAITSAFIFALVSKRRFRIDDSGFYCELPDLFEEPGFNWVAMSRDMLDFSSDAHYIQNPESGIWAETEPLLCANYSHAYTAKHIIVTMNQYFVPYVVHNPNYRDALLQLFHTDDVFPLITKFLFRPIRKLRAERDLFVSRNFIGNFVVGLQVRAGPDFTERSMTKNDWLMYSHCAEAATPTENITNLKYFVATDTDAGRKAAIRHFGKDKVIFGPGPFLLSDHPRGVQMALLDLMLLAEAQDRVMTAWSSFGYFATALSGVPANLVSDKAKGKLIADGPNEEQLYMGVPHKSDRRAQCVRLRRTEPCFHKFESWGASHSSCFKREMIEREMLNGRYC